MMWWDWGFGIGWWVMMVIGLIFMVAFWGGIIFLIVWGVKKLTERGGTAATPARNAIDIARERYARGEISKAEFEQIKKDLS